MKGHPPTPPDESLPFDKVISANIGNPQQLDQKPITFFRQVLSILEYPPLLENEEVLIKSLGYKQDVIDRARWLLSEVHSVGAYSQSQGVPGIRNSVTTYIERRDGYPSDPGSVFLSAGASSGVTTLMNVICAKPETGILVPIPQYPLYTATLAVLNARCVPYYLDESKAWGTDLSAIKSAYQKAKEAGTDVRAIVVINPGNPTGASLSPEDVRSVLEFAAEEKLVVLADEVYQTNIFVGRFTSFKKGLRDLQKEQPKKFDNVELASLNSISKGMVGECGHRGGYFELVGFDKEVQAQIYKFVSIMLCAPVVGQCLVEMQVNPPKEGEPSYPLYREEFDGIAQGLQKRATALFEAFQEMEGVVCQEPQVRFFLFSASYPSIYLSTHPASFPNPPTLPSFFLSFFLSFPTPVRSLEIFNPLADKRPSSFPRASNRAPCTSTPPSPSLPAPSSRRRRNTVPPTSSTVSASSTRRACASCRARGSDSGRGRCIFGLRFWRRGRSGWGGSPRFIRALWMSFADERSFDWGGWGNRDLRR